MDGILGIKVILIRFYLIGISQKNKFETHLKIPDSFMHRRIVPIPVSDSDIEPMKANPCFKTPSFLARSKSVARKAQKKVDVDSDVVQLMDVQRYRKALGLNADSSEDEKTECFEVDSNATEPVEEVWDDERILEVVGPAVEGFFRPDMDAINDDYDYDEPSKKGH